MAGVTSLILIGNSNYKEGGIRAGAMVQLEEGGSRPHFNVGRVLPDWEAHIGFKVSNHFIMIPTINNMVDDVIVFIAYVLLGHKEIYGILTPYIKRFNPQSGDDRLDKPRVEMYDIPLAIRNEMYQILNRENGLPKITFCCYEQSSLLPTLSHLQDYLFECEVLKSIFIRDKSSWGSPEPVWSTRGSLI